MSIEDFLCLFFLVFQTEGEDPVVNYGLNISDLNYTLFPTTIANLVDNITYETNVIVPGDAAIILGRNFVLYSVIVAQAYNGRQHPLLLI